MLKEMLSARKIPEFKSREEMLNIMQKEVYGYLPEKPESISFDVKKGIVYHFCADKALSSYGSAKLSALR